ncbi:1,4-alpha-glucan branching protein GlgB [Inhella gelatinilytica]|uniref:1,4-alpha-glucan branching enzyme GlgB n=1 Tax=Inhella gelatinilytica TaxID=2795030 RepID=A0A931IXE1_9BURK|nr:1,4-alpha-glucan branching protein GlgB [Inhella gelatinilytica]MBH9551768.1 1,4-alpha-glucan branching protein GlgB [Inhella gelatinilytica]
MLDAATLEALQGGRHGDPFAVLGPHPDGQGGLWLRAFLPGAEAVSAVFATGAGVELPRRAGSDLFEAHLGTHPGAYRLRVRWAGGVTTEQADTYAFGALFSDAELRRLRDGNEPRLHELLGAHPQVIAGEAGVRFALWAPNAQRVSVVGGFNGWDGRRHPMRLRHDAGVWELFIPGLQVGELYKYELRTPDGVVLPLKADPVAFAAELRPATASRVVGLPPRRAVPAERAAANRRDAPISVYEVHPASWRRPEGRFPTWDELAAELIPYVQGLGFTHLELLPISEHPFDGSWGYQTLGLFAPTARFGEPEGFARFVQACHAAGLGLLLDWVPAHFPMDAHGLARFDGTALYEYADPKEGFHRDWNTLIYNFGRSEVRSFLASSALYWVEHFGVDGLRVDAVASMLYRDYSRPYGEWVPNHQGGRENLEAIALLKHVNEQVSLAGGFTVAEESTAFPGVSQPTYAGGLGFHFKWNMGWMNDTLRTMHQDPVHRRWHHNGLTFGLVYAFSENFMLPLSHDEVVHGKGSLLDKMPGDAWQQFANLRAYYGFMWGHPGKKLLFMGQEWGQRGEWNFEKNLPWAQAEEAPHTGVRRLVADLNHLYRRESALHRLDCEAAGFEWLVADDAEQSVLAWLRHDGQGRSVMVVCNLTPQPRRAYRIGCPGAAWREALNTDSTHYGGSNVGNGSGPVTVEPIAAHGRSHSVALTLPPLATLFLTPC